MPTPDRAAVRQAVQVQVQVEPCQGNAVAELLEYGPVRRHDRTVQDIDVASGREPAVQRLEVANSVLLTFRGLRNANVRDRDTRVRLTLPGPQAARLWRLLGEQLTDAEKADPHDTAS